MTTTPVSWLGFLAVLQVPLHRSLPSKNMEDVVYCDTSRDEHPDNARFRADIERWLGIGIKVIGSEEFQTTNDVFNKTKYMAGIKGARCTTELKKVPRFNFQQVDDVHIFGYTLDEKKRMASFEMNNPELYVHWILRDYGLTKVDCFDILTACGIDLPAMYALGFKNNNCLGCVKATSPKYWNRIREYFPKVFAEKSAISRKLGVRLTRVKGVRIFLDELPNDCEEEIIEDISCGPQCSVEGK